MDELIARISKLETRVSSLEKPAAVKPDSKSPAPPSNGKSAAVDDDDDMDLFGSGDDDDVKETAEQVRERRLAEYAAKKAKSNESESNFKSHMI